MTYKEIIMNTRNNLHSSISWWPICFYHFTDIHNALGILEKNWIYGRNKAKEAHLMQSDNASKSVIDVTSDYVKEYARLYFRPLTPTQYHNEGFKPQHIREPGINASCPVPIFFCLDAEKILNLEGIEFVECGLAGSYHGRLQHGVEAFSKLNFNKIYHNGPFEKGCDITQYRHSEIVRAGGIPIKGITRKIFCRTLPEKQTFLYMVKNRMPGRYNEISKITEYAPQLPMFYNNGVFIKSIKQNEEDLIVELNDHNMRYYTARAKEDGNDFYFKIVIYWLSDKSSVLDNNSAGRYINYKENDKVIVHLPKGKSNRILVEIYFDDCMMYKNIINLIGQELIE